MTIHLFRQRKGVISKQEATELGALRKAGVGDAHEGATVDKLRGLPEKIRPAEARATLDAAATLGVQLSRNTQDSLEAKARKPKK